MRVRVAPEPSPPAAGAAYPLPITGGGNFERGAQGGEHSSGFRVMRGPSEASQWLRRLPREECSPLLLLSGEGGRGG